MKINFNNNITNKQLENSIISELISSVENFLVKEIYVDKTYKLVVAVSGGVDSAALLDILFQISQKIGFKLHIAHFNHKLRGDNSEKDEEFVRQLAKHYQLEFFYSSGKVKEYAKKNATSIEAAARTLRYNFFEKTTRTLKADFIATAHTSDDNLETFFINLFRGSGLTGLSGIPKVRQLIKNVRIIRPLINFQKADLLEYAKIRKLLWREDESNDWLEFTRNKVRHLLIPFIEKEFNTSIKSQLNKVTKFLQGADEFISTFIDDYYLSIVDTSEENKVILKIAKLNTFNKYIQGEIISQLFKRNFELNQINFIQIDRILDLKNSESGKICEINKFITCFKDRGQLIFTKNLSPLNVDILIDTVSKTSIGNNTLLLELVNRNQVKFVEDRTVEYFDFDKLPLTLKIRNWQEGDSFQPLGMEGSKKISDFLIDNKISNFDKNFVLLLASKSDIVWVMGHQINENYKVTKETKKILKATFLKNQ
jgi:tRNA(Ile)-lysidine synthase